MPTMTHRPNRGYYEGVSSTKFNNPIHNNWQQDENKKAIHFDSLYLSNYIKGWMSTGTPLPSCLIS